jgi:hypothetical protein
MRLSAGLLLLWSLVAVVAAQDPASSYDAEIRRAREMRVTRLRTGDFSPLKKVRTHRLKDAGLMTIGSAPESDIRLEDPGVAPTHAVVEGLPDAPVLKQTGGRVSWTWNNEERPAWTLRPELGLRIGRFGILYYEDAAHRTRSLQVFDPEAPAMKAFRGLEFYPIDAKYRVTAEIRRTPPRRVSLLDSTGREQSWWIYGEARFAIDSAECVLELYTETLDEAQIQKQGFMVMFTDATSGKESYPSTRYVTIEGRTGSAVTIDFNRATTPPCDFSPLYSCPFPRPQNRLPIAIPAGEKWYSKNSDKR